MIQSIKRKLYDFPLLLKIKHYKNFLSTQKRWPLSPPQYCSDFIFQIKREQANDPLRVFVTDKEFVKLYIKATVGDEYNIPTYAILKSEDDIADFFSRPYPADKIVIKPTHMSGPCIITDKAVTDEQRREMSGWFNSNYFYINGEQNYKNLQPKIIVEKFIDFGTDQVPKDYKFFCSQGKIILVFVDEDRFSGHKRTLYDPNWRMLPFELMEDMGTQQPRPDNLEDMIRVAEALSKDFNFIRVDLYTNSKEIYAGEITNIHGNARSIFRPLKADALVGEVIRDPSLNIYDLCIQKL